MSEYERPMGEYKFLVLGLVAQEPRQKSHIVSAISDAKGLKKMLVETSTRQAVKGLAESGLIKEDPSVGNGTILFSATEIGVNELERQRKLRAI